MLGDKFGFSRSVGIDQDAFFREMFAERQNILTKGRFSAEIYDPEIRQFPAASKLENKQPKQGRN